MAGSDVETTLTLQQVREERISREREFYLDEDNFVDYLRDFGAAPDAEERPHGLGARWIMDWKVREKTPEGMPLYFWKMLLWPRGSFKSHCFDAGLTSWLIAKNPDERIMVASETARQAQTFVGLAMEIIESKRYQEVFGNHKGKRWYAGKSFFSSQRNREAQRGFEKEPTLYATGCGEVQTGMHPTWVICDDIVSQENTKTPEAIQTTVTWLAETLAQLDPGCKLLLIGTRHHFADLYGWILKDPDRRAMFEISIHKWINDDGSLFFPKRLSQEFVMGQKAMMPPKQWAAYYENQPYTKDEQLFLPEYFRVIKDEDIPRNVWTYILTDFAFMANEKNDRTAFFVISIDPHRIAYVRDFMVGRWKPSDSCRRLCELWDHWQFAEMKGVAVEATTHKELISNLLEEIRRETMIRPRIIPIEGRSEEVKKLRIEAAEPRFRRGDIYFAETIKRDHHKWVPLIDEMTEWPFSQHDDIPDAISDLDKVNKKGRFFLLHPPMGFNPSIARYHEPEYVNGALNPNVHHDARAMLKSLQHQGQPGSIWQQQQNGLRPVGGDLFGPRRLQPVRPLDQL